ncbi:Flp family type IVb pilin [Herbaspirillum sp. HC18]|nr:Flp family type IVb pilin [Herbaspirillum sp. HC18]
MKSLLSRFAKNESGATAMQYGLIAALIAVAVIVSVKNVGTQTSGTFSNLTTKMK